MIENASASAIPKTAGPTAVTWRDLSRSQRSRIVSAIGWVVGFTLAFVQPLNLLIRTSLDSSLNSYIPLVPFVAAFLLYARPQRFAGSYRSSIPATLLLCAVAAAALTAAFQWRATLSVNDHLGLTTLAYVCMVAAGGFLFLGSRWMAAAAFPMTFLIFMVPLPDAAVYWIERASVLTSADVSEVLFRIAGIPLLRDGTVFALPGIVLEIAQECSGIHSSWILFITSLVASQLFLKSPWRRVILVAFVFPLAIIRNSSRILAIALACVHIGPHMIDSWIHRMGGPIFFALSLGPLFLLLLWLMRGERR